MSADNYYVVCQNPVTLRWHGFMGFASDEDDLFTWHEDSSKPTFDSETEALHHFIENEYSEYGVSSGLWPTQFRVFTTCPKCNNDEEVDCKKCYGYGIAEVWPWSKIVEHFDIKAYNPETQGYYVRTIHHSGGSITALCESRARFNHELKKAVDAFLAGELTSISICLESEDYESHLVPTLPLHELLKMEESKNNKPKKHWFKETIDSLAGRS